jgi:hypothetical protein
MVNVQFIASMAVIAPDPAESRKLYVDALGQPLEASEGDDYFHSEHIGGSKHFGVWPLTQAAQACFGTPEWPDDRPVPQASVEFEVGDPGAVQAAAGELRQAASPCCMTRARSRGGRRSLACSHPRGRSLASRSRPGCTTARDAGPGPGYFALPILYGDRLVGMLDATADRKAGVLRVNVKNQDETFYKASAVATAPRPNFAFATPPGT